MTTRPHNNKGPSGSKKKRKQNRVEPMLDFRISELITEKALAI